MKHMWFSVELCGSVWSCVIRCGVLWFVVELCGVVCGSVWSCVIRCGVLWFVVELCGVVCVSNGVYMVVLIAKTNNPVSLCASPLCFPAYYTSHVDHYPVPMCMTLKFICAIYTYIHTYIVQ